MFLWTWCPSYIPGEVIIPRDAWLQECWRKLQYFIGTGNFITQIAQTVCLQRKISI